MRVNLCSECISAMKMMGYTPFVGNPSTEECTCEMCDLVPETGTIECGINHYHFRFAAYELGFLPEEIWD